jgi:hypothetical protein
MRSLSFTRSSAAPDTLTRPPKVPSVASTGSSSMTAGTSCGAISRSPTPACRTRTSPTGSPCHAPVSDTSTRAPARRSMSSTAVRVGLSPTSRMVTSEPGSAAAATRKNAADDRSPGTRRRQAVSRWPPSTLTAWPRQVTAAPKAPSARSVWSRVAARSTTVDVPAAIKPAKSTADLTWALGTSGSTVIPVRRPPRTVSGGRSPGAASMVAPMRMSGAMTRRIGRRDNEASPTSVVVNGWAATTPLSMRIVLPELPQSSALDGGLRPPTPRPSMATTRGSPSRSAGREDTPAPRAARQASVAAQSAPGA